jgi:peptide-methionine (R)-S-oxide reductase
MDRRSFLTTGIGAALAFAFFPACAGQKEKTMAQAKVTDGFEPLNKPKAEWKKILPAERYAILFEESTERAFTSPLNEEKHAGVFICAACLLPLFNSQAKFDSGTGWPSFWQPIDPKVVESTTDYKLIFPRTEVHCARCEGHQGHIFKDGPKPTGLRYCINGVALKFVAG